MKISFAKALKLCGGYADVSDTEWDSIYCWDLPDDDSEDTYDRTVKYLIDHIEMTDMDDDSKWIRADITGFCKKNWGLMQTIFKKFYKQRLADDPDGEGYYESEEDLPLLYLGDEDDINEDGKYTTGEESIYHAVEAIGDIIVGNISCDFYDWFVEEMM